MQLATKTMTAVIGAVAMVSLTLAMNLLTIRSAQATVAMAKGKPCNTCHTGSPATKENAKKDDAKKDDAKKDDGKKK